MAGSADEDPDTIRVKRSVAHSAPPTFAPCPRFPAELLTSYIEHSALASPPSR